MVPGGAQWILWAIAAACLAVNFYAVAVERDRRMNGDSSLAWLYWATTGILSIATGIAVAILRNTGAGVASACIVWVAALLVALRSTRYLRLFGQVVTTVDK